MYQQHHFSSVMSDARFSLPPMTASPSTAAPVSNPLQNDFEGLKKMIQFKYSGATVEVSK